MNVSSPSTAAAGRRIGKTTEKKIRNVDAPSTRAASMSSLGIACAAYCRIMKTPKPLDEERQQRRRQRAREPELAHQHVERHEAELDRDHHRADHDEQQRISPAEPAAWRRRSRPGPTARRPTLWRPRQRAAEFTIAWPNMTSWLSKTRVMLAPSWSPGRERRRDRGDVAVGPRGHHDHVVERSGREQHGDRQAEVDELARGGGVRCSAPPAARASALRLGGFDGAATGGTAAGIWVWVMCASLRRPDAAQQQRR